MNSAARRAAKRAAAKQHAPNIELTDMTRPPARADAASTPAPTTPSAAPAPAPTTPSAAPAPAPTTPSAAPAPSTITIGAASGVGAGSGAGSGIASGAGSGSVTSRDDRASFLSKFRRKHPDIKAYFEDSLEKFNLLSTAAGPIDFTHAITRRMLTILVTIRYISLQNREYLTLSNSMRDSGLNLQILEAFCTMAGQFQATDADKQQVFRKIHKAICKNLYTLKLTPTSESSIIGYLRSIFSLAVLQNFSNEYRAIRFYLIKYLCSATTPKSIEVDNKVDCSMILKVQKYRLTLRIRGTKENISRLVDFSAEYDRSFKFFPDGTSVRSNDYYYGSANNNVWSYGIGDFRTPAGHLEILLPIFKANAPWTPDEFDRIISITSLLSYGVKPPLSSSGSPSILNYDTVIKSESKSDLMYRTLLSQNVPMSIALDGLRYLLDAVNKMNFIYRKLGRTVPASHTEGTDQTSYALPFSSSTKATTSGVLDNDAPSNTTGPITETTVPRA